MKQVSSKYPTSKGPVPSQQSTSMGYTRPRPPSGNPPARQRQVQSPMSIFSLQSLLSCSITNVDATVALQPNSSTLRRRGVIGGGVLFWLLFLTRKKVTQKAAENSRIKQVSKSQIIIPKSKPFFLSYNIIVRGKEKLE